MIWIKRHLFFLLGVLIAVALLGYAVVLVSGTNKQDELVRQELDEQRSQLSNFYSQQIFPDDNNIKAVSEDLRRMRSFLDDSRKTFERIPPVAFNGERGFKMELEKVIFHLNEEARKSRVNVQSNYFFSFQAQKNLIKFAPQSLNQMAAQLAEVQAICKILYAAKINRLEAIKRARVSEDDSPASTAGDDYVEQTIRETDMARISPYRLVFRCFSSELAAVVNGFVASPHGLVIKTIDLEPSQLEGNAFGSGSETPPPPTEGMAPEMSPPPEEQPVDNPPPRRGRVPPRPPGRPGFAPGRPPGTGGPPSTEDRGGLTMLLNEKPIRVVMFVESITLKHGGR